MYTLGSEANRKRGRNVERKKRQGDTMRVEVRHHLNINTLVYTNTLKQRGRKSKDKNKRLLKSSETKNITKKKKQEQDKD